MPNHREQECPWAGGRTGTVEVSRGNKDSGIDIKFRSHLQLGKGLGMAHPGQGLVLARERKEEGLQMENSLMENTGSSSVSISTGMTEMVSAGLSTTLAHNLPTTRSSLHKVGRRLSSWAE